MLRKIKIISWSIAAVAAMAMAATAAQAFEMHVTTSNDAWILGQQVEQFVLTTNAGTVKCSTATFEGTTQGGSPQITNGHSTLTPTLAGCLAFGNAATIDVNGCKFTLTNKNGAGQTAAQTALVDVTGCTSGKIIEATTAICRLTVPEQHNISHVVFSNTNNTPHDVLATVTLAGVTYQADGPLCPSMPTGQTLSNATTHGQATIATYASFETEQVTAHNHQFQRFKPNQLVGKPVGILVT